MSDYSPNQQEERLQGFRIPSTAQVLSEQLNGTHITLEGGNSFSTGFNTGSPAANTMDNMNGQHQVSGIFTIYL